MKVRSLKIQSFRCIDDLTLNLDPYLTVFLGVNGAGKSSILDALSEMMAFYYSALRKETHFGNLKLMRHAKKNTGGEVVIESHINYNYQFNVSELNSNRHDENRISQRSKDSDIKSGASQSMLNISIEAEHNLIEWRLRRDRKAGFLENENEVEDIQRFAVEFRRKIDESQGINIPLFVHYPASRIITGNISNDFKNDYLESLQILDDLISQTSTNFVRFFQWFRAIEDLENEERRDNPSYRNPQLEAVRRSIPQFLDGFTDLRVRRSPTHHMTISKEGSELVINQLSYGEKCLLAMVADLARRLSIANPGLEDPLKGEGIVLIDELELHLHPQWQRGIISKLLETFPNCQFIISTHSPQIISDVKPENIYVLKSVDNKITATHPHSSFGRDSNQILETVMGVSARPEMIKNQLNDLFRLIDEGKIEEAKVLKSTLSDEIGLDEPQFSKANVLIRRQEILGR
jgi:predicted ATP-binding protein involved in virulence